MGKIEKRRNKRFKILSAVVIITTVLNILGGILYIKTLRDIEYNRQKKIELNKIDMFIESKMTKEDMSKLQIAEALLEGRKLLNRLDNNTMYVAKVGVIMTIIVMIVLWQEYKKESKSNKLWDSKEYIQRIQTLIMMLGLSITVALIIVYSNFTLIDKNSKRINAYKILAIEYDQR